MQQVRFYIEGMTCNACSSGIERALERKSFIQEVRVDLLSKSAVVVFDSTHASLEDIFQIITKLGYSPKESLTPPKTQKSPLWIAIGATVGVLYLSMLGAHLPILLPDILREPFISGFLQALLTLVVMRALKGFYTKGFKALWERQPNMDSLIALGTSSAFLYSLFLLGKAFQGAHTGYYFESACVILVFVMLGKRLESASKQKALDAMEGLLGKQPQSALRVEEEGIVEVLIERVQVGDVLQIVPGSVIPVDGVVVEGESEIDESMLTGESVPVYKTKGALVFSGTLNTTGTFCLKATHTSAQSALQKIAQQVRNAQGSKAQIARLADKVAGVFVPAVIGIASCAFLVWLVLGDFARALEVFISVLVISCPCALGLATPMSLLVAHKEASHLGLFFKDAQALEKARLVSYVVFDKTGTITLGQPQVQHILAIPEIAPQEVLILGASVEALSEHVLAQGIVAYAKDQDVVLKEATQGRAFLGRGMRACIEGAIIKVGSLEFFNTPSPFVQSLPGTWVFVGIEGRVDHILGAFVLQDRLKAHAKEDLERLKTLGLKSMLLSGDTQENVQALEIPLDARIGQASPEIKLAKIEELKAQDEIVMMVGDGLNDAPCLARSDVGLVMASGSDASLEVADIVSFNNEIVAVENAIRLSQATIKNIKQNLFWAFGYNAIAIPLACGVAFKAGIMLSPMLASLAMSLSSLSVVLNAQRLKKVHLKIKRAMEVKLVVPEITCDHCVDKIERFVGEIEGVKHIDVNVATKQVRVEFEPPASQEAIGEAILDAGYTLG
ncbi:copper-translocating P-type ATPase [Helicobacter sp. L8]|uniref:copper-translocating P-type ATPase n=1 Tax=Helicobacter sp. L8 TaxID=2316078 RepID=UPI0013CE28F2|nr:copper-translocating P-type ATPase [Helicobacter sp. L8]